MAHPVILSALNFSVMDAIVTSSLFCSAHFYYLTIKFSFKKRLLILVAREGFLEDKCGPRAKNFEHHCIIATIFLIRTVIEKWLL